MVASASVGAIEVESLDEAALPRGLDGADIVVGADEGDRLGGSHSVEDCQAGQCGPGAPAPTAAGDADAFELRSPPALDERIRGIVPVLRQGEIGPRHPPQIHRWRGTMRLRLELALPAEEDEFEVRGVRSFICSSASRPREGASPNQSTRRQREDALTRRVPAAHDCYSS